MITKLQLFKESMYSRFDIISSLDNLETVKLQLHNGKLITEQFQENIDISIDFHGKNGGSFNGILPLQFNIEKNTNQLLEIFTYITLNDLDNSIDNYSALLPASYESPIQIEIKHNMNEISTNSIDIHFMKEGDILFTPSNIKGSIDVIINGHTFSSNLDIDENDIYNLILPNILVSQGLVEWTKIIKI